MIFLNQLNTITLPSPAEAALTCLEFHCHTGALDIMAGVVTSEKELLKYSYSTLSNLL